MDDSLSVWQEWFAKHRETILKDYFRFLEFNTIGIDPSTKDECQNCADWLCAYLDKVGLKSEQWEAPGHPVVFAQNLDAGPDAPTILLYHHYDVQPVDPLELWESNPFKPELRDGNVYARGAQDNKGQCMYTLAAISALFSMKKKQNFNLKIFIEGDEEAGSPGLETIFPAKKEALACDLLLAVDTLLPNAHTPAITLGMRGILSIDIACRAANTDLHSGILGGVAHNPLRAMSEAFSSLWDKEGRVAVPGFYDQVQEITKEELSCLSMEVDESQITEEFGVEAFAPEPGFSIGASSSIRPTVEINGMNGGYTGEGFKTIIPKEAKGKVSCRLVPNQDPQDIFNRVADHLRSKFPKGMEVEIEILEGKPALWSPLDSPIAKVVAKAYEEVMGKPCERSYGGGSIPILTFLAEASGGEVVMMGFGLSTDRIHAPNEYFGLDRFEQGFLTMGTIFSKFNER